MVHAGRCGRRGSYHVSLLPFSIGQDLLILPLERERLGTPRADSTERRLVESSSILPILIQY